MTDQRELVNALARQVTEGMVARDLMWADYWAEKKKEGGIDYEPEYGPPKIKPRVVVVPDEKPTPTNDSPEMVIHRRDWNDAQSTIAALRQAWPGLQDRERKRILGSSDSFDAALGAYLKRPIPSQWPGPISKAPTASDEWANPATLDGVNLLTAMGILRKALSQKSAGAMVPLVRQAIGYLESVEGGSESWRRK